MITRGPAGLVRRWVELYTRGVPTKLRDRRRTEIDADLWSQLEEAAFLGRPARSTNLEILARWLAGIPADLSWCFEHRGDGAMKTSTAPLGAPSGGAIGVGLTTVVGGVGLAALLLLFYVTSQAVAPADPYYVEGPGVWLVLIGSAAELVLAAALVGISVRYGERFHRLVVAAAAIGGLIAFLAAIGAYWMIVLIPVATVLVAWNLAWLRIVATWLAAAHTLAAALFLWIVASLMQVGAGSAMSPTFLLATAWPLTLAALGVAVVRNDRLPLAEPRIEPAT